jgi:hypothetical protein
MPWVRNVARVTERRNAYVVFVGNPERTDAFFEK